jgi:glycosyltransferase involved in cell wall biosynthesis
MAATHTIQTDASLPEPCSLLPLNIVFVTKADLPEGLGHTVRLKSLVRALKLLGHRVSILNQHSLGVVPESAQIASGELEGAPYRYVLGKCERGRGIGSVTYKLRALKVLARDVRTFHRQARIDLLWFNQLTFYDTYPLTLLARKLEIPTVQAYEDDHLVLTNGHGLTFENRIFSVDARLSDRYCPQLADSIVTISTYLRDKYIRLIEDAKRVHLLPTIVDCELWRCHEEPHREIPIILYAGAFGAQDDLEGLIEALAIVRAKSVQFRMIMLGHNQRDPTRMASIQALIHARGLSQVVEMKGFVPLQEVRRWVEDSNLLLCIRAGNEFARSGLSTKVSEYLASGRMVITSALGDIPKYLVHGRSASLLPSNANPPEIAGAIENALSSYEVRKMIGARGREVAERCFDVPCAKSILENVLRQSSRGMQSATSE